MNTKKLVLTALAVILIGSGAAFAQGNGNSNGHGGGNNGNSGNNRSNGNAGSNDRGAIASELKWRNAAHASDQAFVNASPNSAVGKLATLRDATRAAADEYAAAGVDPTAELRSAADIQSDIDSILTTFPNEIAAVQTAQDNLDAADLSLLTEAEIEVLEGAVTDAQTALDDAIEVAGLDADLAELEAELVLPSSEDVLAEAAAEEVVGVDDLSTDALAALWEMLNKDLVVE